MKRVPSADPGQLPLDLGQGAGETSELSQEGSKGSGASGSPIAGRPAIRIGRGPRVVEADVLAAIGVWNQRVAADPSLLSKPFRLIVPSASLRDHLTGAALRHFGQPLVGVVIQTLFAAALEVLERAGHSTRSGRALVSVEVARCVRGEPALVEALGNLPRPGRIVEASVVDLLDAGLRASDAQVLEEALEENERDGAQIERARAIVRVATDVVGKLESLDVLHRAQLLTNAASSLEDDPELLASSDIAVHGFAEATGAASEFLTAISQTHPTTIWIDEPGEPGHPTRIDPGARFANRLRDRFAGNAIAPPTTIEREQEEAPPRVVELLAAPGAEPEVRAVAGRIRALLDSDPTLEPERIGVVARQPGAYAPLLRTHLGRLGIPYSAVSTSLPRGASARRVAAVAALLMEGDTSPTDRWVSALDSLPVQAGGELTRALRADLRLALRHCGAARLRDVAELELPDSAIRLPVRRGLAAREDGGAVAQSRRLEAPVLAGAIERARSLCARLLEWQETKSVAQHQRRLQALLQVDLGWNFSPESDGAELSALGAIGRELPDGFELSKTEFFELAAERLLAAQSRERVGGLGGGVALLGAMESRARTFEHLFVLGLNRDVFPRVVTEDALLPDALRRDLARDLLPDLPIKATGHDEERYLFAQLFASSRSLVLSWLSTSDDGKKRVRSTLVDRLVGSDEVPDPTSVPALHQREQLDSPGPCTARELALLAGVHAQPPQYRQLVPAALAECWSEVDALSNAEVSAIAASRLDIVGEYAAGLQGGSSSQLGPYLGLLGSVQEAGDLRNATRYVTSLEQMSRCGWQTALQKLLRLEPTPDPLDQFPELTPLVVGNVVHAALEEVLGEGDRKDLDLAAAIARGPVRRSWPADEALRESARRCAKEALEKEGLTFVGLLQVLADRVFQHLVRTRDLLDRPAMDVLGVEVEGRLAVDDGATPHALAFRADLVESIDGVIRLTDFKTGAYRGSLAVGEETRDKAFARDVGSGNMLQAVAYALAVDEPGTVGRYLFVRPNVPEQVAARDFVLGSEQGEAVSDAFSQAVRTLGRAWDAGIFLPKLSEFGGTATPQACEYCDVKEACLQGDTGSRRRQQSILNRARGGSGTSGSGTGAAAEQMYGAFWDLVDKGRVR